MKVSQTVAELPLTEPRAHPPLSEVSQHSHPELSVVSHGSSLLVDISGPTTTDPALTSPGTSTLAERGEPAVATIISLDEEEGGKKDDKSHPFHGSTEDSPQDPTTHPSVRRARSLKHFTPPSSSSPPPSPFSSPATSENAPFISVQKATPKVSVGGIGGVVCNGTALCTSRQVRADLFIQQRRGQAIMHCLLLTREKQKRNWRQSSWP